MSRPEEETPAATNSVESADAGTAESRSGPTPSKAAPLLMGVKLPIRVLMGRTELSLRDITQLTSGSVVELSCSPDSPVEIIVNNRLIARGEIVIVAGNYGVRITQIAARGDELVQQDAPENDLLRFSERLK